MPFAFFSIPAAARPEVASELNVFLRSHRVLRVTQQWHESAGAWAFSVEYVDGHAGSGGGGPAGEKVDYKAALPPEQFEVFARLRALRKEIAEREGTPVFAVFSNAQLAEIVQRGCQSTADLRDSFPRRSLSLMRMLLTLRAQGVVFVGSPRAATADAVLPWAELSHAFGAPEFFPRHYRMNPFFCIDTAEP